MRRLASALFVTAVLAVAGAQPAGAIKVRPSVDATGVGVNGLLTPNGKLRGIADAHVRVAAANHIRIGRTDAFWTWVEPRAPKNGKHRYQWGPTDRIVELLAGAGIRWLPVLDYSAPWAASIPGNDKSPPASDADFAAYAEALARRYGRGGTYWQSHPQLSQLPVTAYEIWNEPNLVAFWQPSPDPARYASLYLAARAAVHRADPQAVALVGGLNREASGYLTAMFTARPDLRGSIDAVGYHPYATDAEGVFRLVRNLRRHLDDAGATSVPLWITEVGWPTQGTGNLSADALPDPTRAANLSLVTDALLTSNCGVKAITPYTWATAERDPEHDEDWLGLYNVDASPTQAGLAYSAAAARNASAAASGSAPLAYDLCYDRGNVFAAPLKLRLAVAQTDDDATGHACFAATVTYRGRALNDVKVRFDDTTGDVLTDTAGTARTCVRRGAGRFGASAAILHVASAARVEVDVRAKR
jgi:hypothetical protein